MKTTEFHWQASNNLRIYGKQWHADNPKAVVCLVHGLGEHCNRYNHVAVFFAKNNIAMMGYDRQGHGQSGGKRGHTSEYDSFLDEIDTLLQRTKEAYPGIPVFLYGHSMGGNLVLNFVLKRKPAIQGVVATGSWIRLPSPPSALLLGFAKMMNLVMPAFSQSNELNASHVSRDEQVVKAYAEDPLVHDRITVSTGLCMLEAAKELEHFSEKMPVPALIMHGSDDHLTDPQGSVDFSKRVGGDVTLKVWDGLYHEIHNEPEQDDVLAFILGWMMKYC